MEMQVVPCEIACTFPESDFLEIWNIGILDLYFVATCRTDRFRFSDLFFGSKNILQQDSARHYFFIRKPHVGNSILTSHHLRNCLARLYVFRAVP